MYLIRDMRLLLPAIRDALAEVPIDFGGGCSLSKAAVLAALCLGGRSRTSIDIGVYRGRSLLPQALAFRMLGGGLVIGVDPYSSGEAVESDNVMLKQQLEQFARETDFDALYTELAVLIDRSDLAKFVRLRRQTSGSALPELLAEGIRASTVHIDGNHDTSIVMEDARNALAIVEPGGFIVVDDISWPSVRPAVDHVRSVASLVYARVDSANDFAVYRLGGGARSLAQIRRHVSEIADMGDGIND